MPLFAALLKPVELRTSVDPLTGSPRPDPKSLGASAADEAALEWALRCRDRWGGQVRAVAAGDDRADQVLRLALAAGADEAVHVELDPSATSESVAHGLVPHVGGADLVWCGDVSLDRGSGSVPAFLAANLRAGQALGLTGIELGGTASPMRVDVLRRLDGGRREQLVAGAGTILSTEGGTARLRRAPLDRKIAAKTAPIRQVAGTPDSTPAPQIAGVGPFRPPARVVSPPVGSSATDRIRSLVGLTTERRTARAVRLDPAEAADAILEALADWGEYP